jgi:general secretion pathway protein N
MAAGGLMRRFAAIVAIGCALTARAAADPIGEHADFRPPVDAGSPGAEGNGVASAHPSPASLTVGPNATLRNGNPLWAIPLTALTATRERPLFSASRRPPVVALPAAPPPKREVLAPPPPEQPSLTLIGTIVSRGASLAMLQGSNAEAISRLRLGQQNDGWRVRGIGLRSILVEKGERSVELTLPRPNGAPAQ